MLASADGQDGDADLSSRTCEGDAMRCYGLGAAYNHGRGVEQDYARAAELFRQACEGGIAISCVSLGIMYQTGRGVTQDYARAAELFRQGCDGGAARACASLGAMYYSGIGVLRDYVIGHALFNLAASRGSTLDAEERARVEDLMTPQQIAEAQALARRCQENGIAACLQ